jgi:hypothetical protein
MLTQAVNSLVARIDKLDARTERVDEHIIDAQRLSRVEASVAASSAASRHSRLDSALATADAPDHL